MKEKITITNEPVDLWNLTEPLPDFPDEYEIWQAQLPAIFDTLGDDYTGSIVGYVEPEERPEYSFEDASGRYNLKAYTPKGELLQDMGWADKFVKWAGCRKLPFVGYVSIDKRSPYASPEGTIWIIIPKSKEQLLSAAATFYKRRKRKDEAPNIVDLSGYLAKPTKIGGITDAATFEPLRKRLLKDKPRVSVTAKKIAEYRKTAPDVTDALLAEAIKDKYNNFFIDNEAVAIEGVREAFRYELPLTKENVLQQIAYLIEDRKLLKYMTALQHIYSQDAQRIRDKADKVVEDIYRAACTRTCKLSEFADEEVYEYFDKEAYRQRKDLSLAEKLNLLCCNYHCRLNNIGSCYPNNFPPFRTFAEGKDVIFASSRPNKEVQTSTASNRVATTASNNNAATTSGKEVTTGEKKGCLLWLILVPSLLGLLYTIF